MFHRFLFLALILASAPFAPALACQSEGQIDLRRTLIAEAVIDADVLSYENIRTADVIYWTLNDDEVPAKHRIRGPRYARLTLQIRKILHGELGEHLVGGRLTVTWGTASRYPGARAIFALERQPASGPGISDRHIAAWFPEPENLTVVTTDCTVAYVLPHDGPLAQAVRQIFGGHGDPVAEADILGEFLHAHGFRSIRR